MRGWGDTVLIGRVAISLGQALHDREYDRAGLKAGDHRPAHVHVIVPDCEALIRIGTLAVMHGQLPIAHRREIMHWIEDNRTLIVAKWNRCNPDIATE